MSKFLSILLSCGLMGSGLAHATTDDQQAWTGSLFGTSATTMDRGMWSMSATLGLTHSNGSSYDAAGRLKQQDGSMDMRMIMPMFMVMYGINNWMDITLSGAYIFNKMNNDFANGWADASVGLGFQIFKMDQGPSLRAVVNETFPTGTYEHLSSLAEVTGLGSYQTALGLVLGQTFALNAHHFLKTSLSVNYTFLSSVDAKGNNSYTFWRKEPVLSESIDASHLWTAIASLEFNLNRHFGVTCDVVYEHFGSKSMQVTNSKNQSSNRSLPEGYAFQLAPALEYNVNSSLGFIVGPSFTLAGENVLATTQWIASVMYSF